MAGVCAMVKNIAKPKELSDKERGKNFLMVIYIMITSAIWIQIDMDK